MAQKSDKEKQKELRQESERIWRWLRKYPPYKKDFLAQQKGAFNSEEAYKRYGFCPLENPKEKDFFPVWDYIGYITGINSAPEAIHLKTVSAEESSFFSESTQDCYNGIPDIAIELGLPKITVIAEIYPYKDADLLASEFKKKIRQWQIENKIRPKRFTVGDIFLAYKARVMRGLGFTEEKIRKKIKSKIPGSSNANSKEAARQKTSRILNRLKTRS